MRRAGLVFSLLTLVYPAGAGTAGAGGMPRV